MLWIIPTLAITQNWPKKHWSLLDLEMFWSVLTFTWLNFFWNFVLNFYLGDILKWIHSPPNQGFFGCQIFPTWWQKRERPANCQRLFEGIKGPQVVIFQGGEGVEFGSSCLKMLNSLTKLEQKNPGPQKMLLYMWMDKTE